MFLSIRALRESDLNRERAIYLLSSARALICMSNFLSIYIHTFFSRSDLPDAFPARDERARVIYIYIEKEISRAVQKD